MSKLYKEAELADISKVVKIMYSNFDRINQQAPEVEYLQSELKWIEYKFSISYLHVDLTIRITSTIIGSNKDVELHLLEFAPTKNSELYFNYEKLPILFSKSLNRFEDNRQILIQHFNKL